MFEPKKTYTKKDIYRILDVPIIQQGGNWNTGYNRYKDDFFLFCNIGVAGRTGHDYNNHWNGNELIWFGKSNTTVSQGGIKDLLSNNYNVHIFTRVDSSSPFTFHGLGIAKGYKNTTPVEIIWTFKTNTFHNSEILPEEVPYQDRDLWEGSTQEILVNKYERNPEARKQCIEHFGWLCQICEFDFELNYGNIGKQFIHVHHLIPISKVKKGYVINPVTDLIPICPNCHAIIHKRIPCLTINEVKKMKALSQVIIH